MILASPKNRDQHSPPAGNSACPAITLVAPPLAFGVYFGYSQSRARLLQGRYTCPSTCGGIRVKEPIQEPTQADFRRHPATLGDCQA